jgi:hypothetical protein
MKSLDASSSHAIYLLCVKTSSLPNHSLTINLNF